MASSIFELIQSRLASMLDVERSSITENTRFVEDLGLDSLTAVELLIDLEEQLGVSVTDEQAGQLDTPADLIALIQRAQS